MSQRRLINQLRLTRNRAVADRRLVRACDRICAREEESNSHAEYKSLLWVLAPHRCQSRNRLIFKPVLPTTCTSYQCTSAKRMPCPVESRCWIYLTVPCR